MKKQMKLKRASILAIIIYIMINSFVWGLMKVYINSYNAVNREKLVMAQISDKPDGRKIEIMGQSFVLPEENKNDMYTILNFIAPAKIKSISEIFKLIEKNIVQEVWK